jgi:hypothetical protein
MVYMGRVWIKKLTFFVLPLLMFTIAAYFGLQFWVENRMKKWSPRESQPAIFLGDSQIQVAINDSLIPFSHSYAAASEPLFITYYKLKFLAQKRSHVQRVLLGINFHSFSTYYDEFIYNESMRFRNFHLLPRVVQYSVFDHQHLFFKYFAKHIVNRVWEEFQGMDEEKCWGCFQPRSSDKPMTDQSVLARIEEQYYPNRNECEISNLNMDYLDSIQVFCAAQNWELMLIQNPVSLRYFEKVPEKFKLNLFDVERKFQGKIFNSYNMGWPDSLFLPDGDHLNPAGSKLCSQSIAKWLEL